MQSERLGGRAGGRAVVPTEIVRRKDVRVCMCERAMFDVKWCCANSPRIRRVRETKLQTHFIELNERGLRLCPHNPYVCIYIYIYICVNVFSRYEWVLCAFW